MTKDELLRLIKDEEWEKCHKFLYGVKEKPVHHFNYELLITILSSDASHLVATVVHSLAVLKKRHFNFHFKKFEQPILKALEKHIIQMEPRGLANTLWALVYLFPSWNSLSYFLRAQLIIAIENKSKNLNTLDLSQCVWSFFRLNVKWEKLPWNLQKLLLEQLSNNVGEMNHQQLLNSFAALVGLGLTSEQLNIVLTNQLVTSLTIHIVEMTPFDMVESLRILVHLGFTWPLLSDSLQKKIFSALQWNQAKIDVHIIPECLWALARLEMVPNFALKCLIRNLLRKYSEKYSPQSVEELRQLLSAFYYFSLFCPGLICYSAFDKPLVKQLLLDSRASKTQHNITAQINAYLSSPLEEEQLLFCFVVDACLDRIVVEIDGPFHDSPHQKLIDQFQNKLLSKYGYTTIRVSVKHLEALPDEEGIDALQLLAEAIKKQQFNFSEKYADLFKVIPAEQRKQNYSAQTLSSIGLMSTPKSHANSAITLENTMEEQIGYQ